MSRSCAEKLLRRDGYRFGAVADGLMPRFPAGFTRKVFLRWRSPDELVGGAEYRQHNVIVPGRSHTTNKSIRGRLYRDEHPNLPLLPQPARTLSDFTKLYPRDTAQKMPPPSFPPTGKTA